jgi:hypothetical protein
VRCGTVGLRKNGDLIRPPLNKDAEIHLLLSAATRRFLDEEVRLRHRPRFRVHLLAESFGSTLSNDRHAQRRFDYLIANPPYGKDWKRDEDAVRAEYRDYKPIDDRAVFTVAYNKLCAVQAAQMRLQLTHWLSGLTCFSLEDLYLSVGVQMDLVKRCEIAATSHRLSFFQGMTLASSRYGLAPLGPDYKCMRNDIVHEGVLSGSNFVGKSKADCAQVTANTLNWLDRYVLAALGLSGQISGVPRWDGNTLLAGLPAITVR